MNAWKLRTNDGERGSIPLALLVVIVLGGLLTTLLSRTIAESGSTLTDNERTTALHAAERGIDDALYRLNNKLIVTTTAEDSGTADGYDYRWRAVRQIDRSWEVVASAEGPNGVRRTITARLKDRPIWEQALATHLGINFGGGNIADSYNSATQTRCSPPSKVDCYGIIASNGDITMGSSSTTNSYADRVHVYDMGNPLNNGATRCSPTSSLFCQPPIRRDFRDALDIRGDVPFTQRMLDACAAGSGFGAWKASTYATGSGQNRRAVLDAAHPDVKTAQLPINGENRTILCLSTLHFDVNTTVPTTVTPQTGYLVVVRDNVQIDGAISVNCAGCAAGFPASPNMPKARLLQIFTLAQDQVTSNGNVAVAVQVRQHAKIGAGIYAPDASCGNLQSNAQVEVYGALICASVLNQGGWSFHYDEDLLKGMSTEQFMVDRWTEQ